MTNETINKPHPYHQVLQWVAEGKEIEVHHTESGCYLQLDTNTILRIVLAGTDDKSYKQPQDFRLKPQRHVHQDLIDAFEKGAEIQVFSKSTVQWRDSSRPYWFPTEDYRIKPKDDTTQYAYIVLLENGSIDISHWTNTPTSIDNLKVVFDGETNKIKSVEII